MKRLPLLLIAALAIASAPALAQQGRAESELIKLEQDYARALVSKDMAFLRAFYAPDWRGGNWLGFFTKSTLLKRLQDRRYVIKSMKVRDLRVKVMGDVAVVQGVDEEITSMSGRDTSGLWGFTDVFARRGGRWVAVASQTTRIDPQRP
ncbi:nuclear transport factor 2 family protein [Sphingomonas sp.]|jgi:ketosteroid isomerase-like protein|uniref:nuclear transport factor 2 family protein n=1 Tax=Sphingomonas sp. TaxID=28214 RepID=UPI002DF23382|nr:nuclear transport factor 2 family protein [Sphingomonas sp.]